MGMEMKGAMHIVESCIAIFLIFSFIILVLPKPTIDLDETKYITTYSALKSVITSGIVDNSLKENNLSEINSYLLKILPWDFESFIERANISSYIIDQQQENIVFYVNTTKTNLVILDILSPKSQQINITVNSKLVYSSITSETYGIDITDKIINGNNQLRVEKSGNKPVYVVLKLSYENTTLKYIPQEKISVMFPYYIGEVKYVYVLV